MIDHKPYTSAFSRRWDCGWQKSQSGRFHPQRRSGHISHCWKHFTFHIAGEISHFTLLEIIDWELRKIRQAPVVQWHDTLHILLTEDRAKDVCSYKTARTSLIISCMSLLISYMRAPKKITSVLVASLNNRYLSTRIQLPRAAAQFEKYIW